jgi:ABC-2 type transport system ATP-binding protein
VTAVLNVENLSKAYGSKQALRNVSFSVAAGTCFGLLGPNGAGKSTTMKIITGIIDGDDGTVTVLGHDSKREREKIRKEVGYVPQEITLYEKLSAFDNLVFFGELYGMKGAVLKKRIDEVLEQVGLADRAKDAVGTFSGGMKRRINFAAALLHKPNLIILDEPTVGIDPQSRNHIFNMISDLKKAGVTVVYSTHYMEEVETLCDHIAIIDHGQVIAQGSLEDLLEKYGRKSVYVEAEGWSELPQLPYVKQIKEEKRGWMIETDHLLETMNNITKAALEQDIIVHQLEIKRPSLETVFLSLTGTTLRD